MWAFEHAGHRPRRRVRGEGDRERPAAVGDRDADGARQERWGRGAHGTTYGGNPVACAAGIAVLETIRDEELVENARPRGAELTGGLRELMADHPGSATCAGPGLMIGVEFVKDRANGEPDGRPPRRWPRAPARPGCSC